MQLHPDDCSADLFVAVHDGRFQMTFPGSGPANRRRLFRSADEVVRWAEDMTAADGQELYIHLRIPAGNGSSLRMFTLARKLAIRGLMTGVSSENRFAGPRAEVYNYLEGEPSCQESDT